MYQGQENNEIQTDNRNKNNENRYESMDVSFTSNSILCKKIEQHSLSQLPLTQHKSYYLENCKIKHSDVIYCSEYSQDVLNHWLEIESMPCYIISPNLLSHTSLPVDIFKKMRVTLFDWLISIQLYLGISNDALHLCMSIVDRFTCQEGKLIERENYQLIALACVSLACKYEDVNIPSTSLLCELSDNAYNVHQLCKMEKLIYVSMNYCLGNPQPNCFLRFFSILFDRNSTEHNLAKYFVEISLIFPCLAHIRSSLRAMTCLSLASELINGNLRVQTMFQKIPKICQNELVECVQLLKPLVKEVLQSETKYCICKKFKDKKYRGVSDIQCLHKL